MTLTLTPTFTFTGTILVFSKIRYFYDEDPGHGFETTLMPRITPKVELGPIHRIKADFFRALGHPVRVRILELLKSGEMTVGDLQAELGIDSSGTSQHLGALRRQGLLEARKQGRSVYYQVRDPRIFQLLESARQVIGSHLEEANALLGELGGSTSKSRRTTTKTRSR